MKDGEFFFEGVGDAEDADGHHTEVRVGGEVGREWDGEGGHFSTSEGKNAGEVVGEVEFEPRDDEGLIMVGAAGWVVAGTVGGVEDSFGEGAEAGFVGGFGEDEFEVGVLTEVGDETG